MLLAHAGNRIDPDGRGVPRFPPSQVAAVTTVIARVLADLGPSAVVSSAANGADLIVLEESQRLGISTHIVLPLPAEKFCEQSVAAAGKSWVERFQHVLDAAGATDESTLEILDLGTAPDWYLVANGLILDRARAVAEGYEAVIAMTVRPPEGETPPSATDDFARRATEAGLTVFTLDPRPSRGDDLRIA